MRFEIIEFTAALRELWRNWAKCTKATAATFQNVYVQPRSSLIDQRRISFPHVKNSCTNLSSM